MNKTIIITTLLFPFLVAFLPAKAQEKKIDYCLEGDYHENCFIATKSIFDDLIYLKSRPFSRESSKQKFVVNLKRNTLYLFNICQGVKSKAVVTIYDGVTEEPIVSTRNPENGKFNRALNFYTKSTGQYLISVDFTNSNDDCIVVLMGMIRKNVETYVKLPAEK